MSARVVIGCDAAWPGTPPMDCRGSLPTQASSIDRARGLAESYGWSCTPGRDLCPSHARREREFDAKEGIE